MDGYEGKLKNSVRFSISEDSPMQGALRGLRNKDADRPERGDPDAKFEDAIGPISEEMVLSVRWPEQAKTPAEKMKWLRQQAIKRALGEQAVEE